MTIAVAAGRRGNRLTRLGSRVFGRNVMLMLAAVMLTIYLVCALAPGLLAPHDPLQQNLRDTLLGPWTRGSDGGFHVLGTDALGRDVFSRIVYGSRLSLGVGLGATIVSACIGVPLGLLAGYRGGWFDSLMMRTVDAIMSFPSLVLYIFMRFVIGGGVISLILLLSIFRWVGYVRVTRSVTLTYREVAFVEAARSVGCSDRRIVFRHVLPNVIGPLVALALTEVAMVILAESSMSFLGLGVLPPTPSWGQMISEGRQYLVASPGLVMFPGITIFTAVLSLSLVGRRAVQLFGGDDSAG